MNSMFLEGPASEDTPLTGLEAVICSAPIAESWFWESRMASGLGPAAGISGADDVAGSLLWIRSLLVKGACETDQLSMSTKAREVRERDTESRASATLKACGSVPGVPRMSGRWSSSEPRSCRE